MIPFAKYHGCGNSFIIFRESDLIRAGFDGACAEKKISAQAFSKLAEAVCSEQTGIGADGMITVREKPGLEMIFYNRDGSRAPMCGNGIRCFARYCRENGIAESDSFSVDTLAGIMKVDISFSSIGTDRHAADCEVEINMGRPDMEPAACSIVSGDPFLDRQLKLSDGTEARVSSFFMGTVHTVLWDDENDLSDPEALGAQICTHEAYPEKTNVNMARLIDRKTLELKTYERGVGMTCACGTGACAAVVDGIRTGRLEGNTDVLLPYGKLSIRENENGEIMMKGPAAFVAEGGYMEEAK